MLISIFQELVAEKQYRLKESMKMMGLSNWLHWLAWFIKNFIFLMISTILITILVKVSVQKTDILFHFLTLM